jgi:hypothetical protein
MSFSETSVAMTTRVARADGNPERAPRRGHGVALAREAVLHPQEQSYIGSWCRDRSHRVRPIPEGAAKFGDYLGLS